jgi:hypothetical protein
MPHVGQLSGFGCFARMGKRFCVLTAYFDESYNKRTFCVGGWLCPDDEWTKIVNRWMLRIRHENQISRKQNLRAVTRFHASDCATFGGEFRGWDQARQVGLMKKLTEIIRRSKPIGIATSAQLGDFVSGYPGHEQQRHRGCYFFAMMACLLMLGDLMSEQFQKERVTIIYDRGNISEWAAQKAFSSMKNDLRYEPRKYFVTIAPMGWEDCAPLQVADLLAYEGYKVIDRKMLGSLELRRSLESIIGHGVPLRVQSYRPDAFRKLATMQKVMEEAQGNPTVNLRKVMDLVQGEWRRDRLPS